MRLMDGPLPQSVRHSRQRSNSIRNGFRGGVYFVRDKRFRLHEDGRFYKIPVSDLEARYSMETLPDGINLDYRQRLQNHLDAFMDIKQTDISYTIVPFGTDGDAIKNRMDAENAARE